MDLLGTIAGGALGYIHGNTRGAIKGAYWGRKLAQNKYNMAPIPKKRKTVTTDATYRSRPRGAVDPARKRNKVSHKVFADAKHNYGPGRSGYNNVYGNPSAVAVKRKKKVRNKKRKRLQITSLFKRKVNQALAGHLYGSKLDVGYFRMTPLTVENSQKVLDLGILFNPVKMIHAADVLFNGATPVETPGIGDLKWQNTYIRKDFFTNSWFTMELKNLSQRTYTLKFYTCAPKIKIPSHMQNISTNNAVADWEVGLQLMNTGGTNPQNNVKETLYADPRDVPQFNTFWRAEMTTVILKPGESYTYFVQGPSQLEIDWSKYLTRGITGDTDVHYASYGPWSRACFVVYYPDLVTGTLANSGRYPSGGVGSGGISVEVKTKFSLQCPESAGFVYPVSTAAGVNQQLNNKKPTKVIKIWSGGLSGTVQDILEENPLSAVDPID